MIIICFILFLPPSKFAYLVTAIIFPFAATIEFNNHINQKNVWMRFKCLRFFIMVLPVLILCFLVIPLIVLIIYGMIIYSAIIRCRGY